MPHKTWEFCQLGQPISQQSRYLGISSKQRGEIVVNLYPACKFLTGHFLLPVHASEPSSDNILL